MIMEGGIQMLNYKNILVPYDGSDHARKALEHAIDLAQCSKECKIYIATIFSKAKALKHSEEKSVEELRQLAKDELEKAAAKVPETVKKETIFLEGEPRPELLMLAEEHNCDLIVMGSRGLGPIEGILMGSVSSYLVSHSKAQVYIIK